jgi:hypothetical protein
MGDWSVSCGISGIPLYTEDVVFIPLHLTDKKFDLLCGSAVITNEGPNEFFEPYYLPIFGEYNGYGNLNNIIRDANVECIEKNENVKIKDYIEATIFPDKTKLHLNGMYVHRKIYEHFSKYLYSDLSSQKVSKYSIWENRPFALSFKNFGLELKPLEEVTNFDAKFLLQYNDKSIEISKFGYVKNLSKRSKKYISTFGDVVKFLNIKEIDVEYCKTTNYLIPLYNEFILGKKIPFKPLDEYVSEAVANGIDPILADTMYLVETTDFFFYPIRKIFSTIHFGQVYKDKLVEIRDLFCDFQIFYENLYLLNRMFMPSWCGTQFSNAKANKKMHEIAKDICTKIFRENNN